MRRQTTRGRRYRDVAPLVAAGRCFEESEPVSATDEKRKAEMARLEERPITPEDGSFWAFRNPRGPIRR